MTDRTPTRFPPLPDVPPEAWEDRMNDWPDRTPTEPYCEECRHHPGRSLHATHARTPTTAAGRRLVADATDHPIWASAMLGYVLDIEAEARAEGLDVERCRYCGKPFNGKPHSHGVRYLPRPKGPPPPPPPPTPGPLSVDPDMDQL